MTVLRRPNRPTNEYVGNRWMPRAVLRWRRHRRCSIYMPRFALQALFNRHLGID